MAASIGSEGSDPGMEPTIEPSNEPSSSKDASDANSGAVKRLHQAVVGGDESLVRELLKQDKDLASASSTDGQTALQLAVQHDRLSFIPILRDHGADMEAPDAEGRTPLYQAVNRNNVALTTVLLECGANVEAATHLGEKPLWVAASKGHEQVARLLLQCKADVESFNPGTGTTALLEAINHNHVSLVKLLLDSGADIDARPVPLQQAIPRPMAPPSGAALSQPPANVRVYEPNNLPVRVEPEMVLRPKKEKAKSAPSWIPWKAASEPKVAVGYRKHGPSRIAPEETMAPPSPVTLVIPPSERKHNRSKAPVLLEYLSGSARDRHARTEPVRIRPAPDVHRPRPPTIREEPSFVEIDPELERLKEQLRRFEQDPKLKRTKFFEEDSRRFDRERREEERRFERGARSEGEEEIERPKRAEEVPLHQAVQNGNIEIVRLLLERGADKSAPGKDGRSAQQVADAQEDQDLAALLRSEPLLEGPWINKEKGKSPDAPKVVPQTLPPPRDSPAKIAACQSFEATMVEFYIGDREQRHQKAAPVYDVLYGEGPQAILARGRPKSAKGKTPNFTWYHLPANNMEWVDALITRLGISQQERRDTTTSEDDLKERLGILRPKIKKVVRTARPSFLRSYSKEIWDDALSTEGGHVGTTTAPAASTSSLFAFIPYLHFESEHYHKFLRHILSLPPLPPPRPPPPPPPPPPAETGDGSTARPPSTHQDQEVVTPVSSRRHTPRNPSDTQSRVNSTSDSPESPKTTGPDGGGEATEPPTQHTASPTRTRLTTADTRRSSIPEIGVAQEEVASTSQPDAQPDTQDDAQPNAQSDAPAANDQSEPSEAPTQERVSTESQRRPAPKPEPPFDPTVLMHPYEHLINGYFRQAEVGNTSGWQPRRSLDEYFHSHLADLRARDSDQVVLRYMRGNRVMPPKIFMVDQLWVWILRDDTILTCSSLHWDAWMADTSSQDKKTKGRGVYVPVPDDPMNLHHKVLQHLKSVSRRPITTAHDLAYLVADTCTGLFDQHEVPEEFQFFDFFEYEIARLSDTVTRGLEQFKASIYYSDQHDMYRMSNHAKDIKLEIAVLIEVQDICDELEILRKVLEDQSNTLSEMGRILTGRGHKGWTESKVNQLHTAWVERMQEMAKNTKDSLYHLLDLKQKQANFSEAYYARKGAEETAEQTKLAADSSQTTADQLIVMNDQAEESARQGKTLLVFTVVTIVFLPSSFMAAIFAISLDAFPLDDNGKMPLNYFLKYLFAISLAITIPLIGIAFTIPYSASWYALAKSRLASLRHHITSSTLAQSWRKNRDDLASEWPCILTATASLVLEAALVAAIWAAPLGRSVKIAVTACVSVVVGVVVVGCGLWAWNGVLKRRMERAMESSSDSSSGGRDVSFDWEADRRRRGRGRRSLGSLGEEESL